MGDREMETYVNRPIARAICAIAFVGGALSAEAADLPTQKTPAIFTPTPAYSWAGFYAGVNGGYAWGQQDPLGLVTNKFDSATYGISGGVFGGTFGAQLQQGHVVFGLESDIDWAGITGSRTFTPTIAGVAQPFSVATKAEIDWIGTGRLRIGFAQENWLFFATAGLAMMGDQPHLTVLNGLSCSSPGVSIRNCSHHPLQGGLAVGGGVEYGFSPAWSAKLEYIYIGQIDGINTQNANLFRVGLNYRFGG
jgi:outer membrane immunogenic protein